MANFCCDCGKRIGNGTRVKRCHPCAYIARRGTKQSAEAIRKRVEAMTGMPRSPEWRKKISDSLKGRKVGSPSEETRKKISASLTGKKRTPEQRQNMSKASLERERIANLAIAEGMKPSDNLRRRPIGDTRVHGGYVMQKTTVGNYRSNWVAQHRYIMEKNIGRHLERGEHVHHINGIKTDNRIENLMLISAKDHNKVNHFLGLLSSSSDEDRIKVIRSITERYPELCQLTTSVSSENEYPAI